jgi:23S rRNA (pseudouridine1915-N3)-methyltransferase
MRIDILAVGRLKAGSGEHDLVARYLERARAGGRAIGLAGFEVAEIPDGKSADAEAEALLARMKPGSRRVVLDERGKTMTSGKFAETLAGWRDQGVPATAFLIGGPDGHGKTARQGADFVLSFGAMTWPHQLVRAMVAEQLYRATTILTGHPYHRA